MVTHLPPSSGVDGSEPEPYVGKLVVPYRWSAHKTTHHDMTCTVLKAM